MKIVTLNIRHGGGTRAQKILSYLEAQDADVIVLTEFRENANADIFRSELGSAGYKSFASASIAPKENSVCIASRFPFVPRTYPNLKPKHLHRVMSAHFEHLTVFGVYFPQNQAKAEVFEFFINQAHESQDEPHLIVGDFNTGIHELDEVGSTFHCSKEFSQLSSSGLVDSWRTRNPDVREFSWFSNAGNGFRIDHAFSSPTANCKVQQVYYDHSPRETKITDHSSLVVLYSHDHAP